MQSASNTCRNAILNIFSLILHCILVKLIDMKSIYLRSFVLKLMALVVILLVFVNTIKTQSNTEKLSENTESTNIAFIKEDNLGR